MPQNAFVPALIESSIGAPISAYLANKVEHTDPYLLKQDHTHD